MSRYIQLESGPTPSRPERKEFQRRYYRGLNPFWSDLKYLFRHRAQIREAMRAGLIPLDFRERLMLAVTEVNGCRYCRTFHIGQARDSGISQEEIQIYLLGTIPEDIPEDQKLAVCYAQHWAENNTQADELYETDVREWYGEERFRAINIILRMIWMGNMLGNSWDYLLFRFFRARYRD